MKKFNKYTSLSKWLLYIKNIYPNQFDNSLGRILSIAKKLNLFNNLPFIITVSGTNGKGSTCFFLEKCFLNAGYCTGLYTSPHLLQYYERIRVNGKNVDDSLLHTSIFEKIENVRCNTLLTYFEFITLSALLIFQIYDLDVIILEVGLGGRLDATNIVNANIVIITNIGLDHIEFLGNDRNKIGYEKSGIFRKGIDVVIGDKDIPDSVYNQAYLMKVLLHRFKYEWGWIEYNDYWNFYDKKGIIKKLPIPNASISNVALAIEALSISKFNIQIHTIKKSIQEISLLGRFQKILDYPTIIVDVAHNSHAAQNLCIKLKKFLNLRNVKIYGVFGMLIDKDIKNTILILSNVIDYWNYSPLKTIRTTTINNVKSFLPKNTVFFKSIEEALYQLIKKINKQDIIIVFGSFFAVFEAFRFIKKYYNNRYNKIIKCE